MKCPACGNKLHKIAYMTGEYYCSNNDCPAFKRGSEWYGDTQSEINNMWPGTPAYYKKAQKKEGA